MSRIQPGVLMESDEAGADADGAGDLTLLHRLARSYHSRMKFTETVNTPIVWQPAQVLYAFSTAAAVN